MEVEVDLEQPEVDISQPKVDIDLCMIQKIRILANKEQPEVDVDFEHHGNQYKIANRIGNSTEDRIGNRSIL